MPLKAVAEELCVSMSTLWRARQSDLPGFPKPTIIHRQVFWKKSELEAIDEAMDSFRGRTVFEQQRQHSARVARLLKTRAPRLKLRGARRNPAQSELF